MQIQLWKNFQVETTADSSPTLRLNGAHPLDQTKSAESMHHSGGAATETLYIYGEAINWALSKFPVNELRISSVGLGLGYNEILVAILILQNPAKSAKLESFEIDGELKDSFNRWVFEHDSDDEIQQKKNLIYNKIFQLLTEKIQSQVKIDEVKKYLQQQIQSGQWLFLDELNYEKIPDNPCYHLCLFDAFSQKTTQSLWDEKFLDQFIKTTFDSDYAGLATYACTGVLTRALKSHGFSVLKKPGFQGKRDCTWAERKK